MAHSDNARKRIRQNRKANLHNRKVKSTLRTSIKNLRVAIAGNSADTGKLLSDVESKLDKAAKRNIIPTGRANRLKGRLKRTLARAAKPAA
ncbi:MAG: 30S ribosomal protein S20 [Planctomycetes bacterium]|jgi:small subunit ribosomal protein S20|nr:30S ribosomal protein S20 [Planctomycetota bacterium]MCL4730896.1 30S ribosomal protein S20 [Planctomycetota bacterium]